MSDLDKLAKLKNKFKKDEHAVGPETPTAETQEEYEEAEETQEEDATKEGSKASKIINFSLMGIDYEVQSQSGNFVIHMGDKKRRYYSSLEELFANLLKVKTLDMKNKEAHDVSSLLNAWREIQREIMEAVKTATWYEPPKKSARVKKEKKNGEDRNQSDD